MKIIKILIRLLVGVICFEIGALWGFNLQPNKPPHMEPVVTFPNGDSVWLHQPSYERPEVWSQDREQFGVAASAVTSKSRIDIRWHARQYTCRCGQCKCGTCDPRKGCAP